MAEDLKYSKFRKNAPVFYFFGSILINLIIFIMEKDYVFINYPYNLIGIIFLVLGVILLNDSSKIFNKKQTTFLLEKPVSFVTEGHYKYTRNPMYLGMFMLILGEAFIFGNLFCFIVLTFFVIIMTFFCIIPEEKIMEKTFGKEYLRYKKRVRRWI